MIALQRAVAATARGFFDPRPPPLCVDLDGVLAFLLEASLGALNAHFGTSYQPSAASHYNFEDYLPGEQRSWLLALFARPAFYATLAPDYRGLDALTELADASARPWFVSDRPANTEGVSRAWLDHWHVPVTRLICGPGSKAAIAARYPGATFIDDDPAKVGLAERGARVWLLARPWTRSVRAAGVTVFARWSDVVLAARAWDVGRAG